MALTQAELTSWIKWLRDKSLYQTHGKLFNGTQQDTYCCLGVLCEKVSKLERLPRGEEGYRVPSTLRTIELPSEYTHGLAPHALIHQSRQRVLSTFNDGDASTIPARPQRTFADIAEFLEARGLAWVNAGEHADGESLIDAAFFDGEST